MAIILLACGPCVVIVNCLGQVLYLGRAPRTKEILPDFHEWCRVTRHPRLFHGLTVVNGPPGMGSHSFNPYKDLCNLIEYMLRGFEFIASSNVNPLGIFKYTLASRDPYKYVVTTSIRRISSPSETTKLIKYQNVIVSITGEYVSS